MDDLKPKNESASRWVIVNSVNMCESEGKTDSDPESDGISIISESSHVLESNTDEECGNDLSNQQVAVEGTIEKDTLSGEQNCSSPSAVLKEKEKRSSKWTLVSDNKKSNTPTNKFYLNCLQEPVIEISDNDLDSIHSETSDLMESNSNSTCEDEIESLNFANSYDAVQVSLQPQQYGIKKFVTNSIFMGIIILITSLLLGLFLTEKIDEDATVYSDINQEDLVTTEKYDEYQNVDIVEYCIEKHKDDQGLIGTKINACVKKTKTKLDRKPSKMLETDMLQKMDLYLKLKERLLEVKERVLLLREMRLLEAELGLRRRYKQIRALHSRENLDSGDGNSENIYFKMFPDSIKTVSTEDIKKIMKTDLKVKGDMGTSAENLRTRDFKEDIEKILSVNSKNKPDSKQIKKPVGPEVVKEYKKTKQHFKTDRKNLKKKLKMEVSNGKKFKCDDSLNTKQLKDEDEKLKEERKSKKRKIDTDDDTLENKKYKETFSEGDNRKKLKEYKNYKEQKKNGHAINIKEKDELTKAKILKYSKIQKLTKKQRDYKYETDVKHKKYNKEKNHKNISKNKTKYSSNEYLDDDIVWFLVHSSADRFYEVIANLTRRSYDSVKEANLNSTLSGNWYMNLHKGRDYIRKREHMADWYFDRSYMRKLQRMDKAKWYFDWMSSRDKVRYSY